MYVENTTGKQEKTKFEKQYLFQNRDNRSYCVATSHSDIND